MRLYFSSYRHTILEVDGVDQWKYRCGSDFRRILFLLRYSNLRG